MMIPVKIPLDHPVMITLGQDFSLLTIYQQKRLHQRKVMIRKHSRHLKLRIYLMIQHPLNPVVSGKPQKDVKNDIMSLLEKEDDRFTGCVVIPMWQEGAPSSASRTRNFLLAGTNNAIDLLGS